MVKNDFGEWSKSVSERINNTKPGEKLKTYSTVKKSINMEDLDHEYNLRILEKTQKSNQENPPKNKVVLAMIAIFGIIGLSIGGIGGAIAGGVLGFAFSAIFLGAMDAFK